MFIIKRLSLPVWRTVATHLFLRPVIPNYSFAVMQLFESPKKPEQLSPIFKKSKRLKGHMKQKHRKGYISPKLNRKVRVSLQRLKNHKGMLKRVKIVGPRWNRRFKRLSAHHRHLRRNKSRQNLKRKTLAHYISKADMGRVKKLIPYYKRKSLKRLY